MELYNDYNHIAYTKIWCECKQRYLLYNLQWFMITMILVGIYNDIPVTMILFM